MTKDQYEVVTTSAYTFVAWVNRHEKISIAEKKREVKRGIGYFYAKYPLLRSKILYGRGSVSLGKHKLLKQARSQYERASELGAHLQGRCGSEVCHGSELYIININTGRLVR